MEPITYSLAAGDVNSERYYDRVRACADDVLGQASKGVRRVVEEYRTYIELFRLEELRSEEEYIFELLSFGVLWRSYSGTALAVRHAPFVTLARMAEWRKHHQRWKPWIDLARGVLTTAFLLPARPRRVPDFPPTLDQIDRFCVWMEATGEFREQALRFVRWRAFWEGLDPVRLERTFDEIGTFCAWFEERSRQVLGEYTGRVESFLSQRRSKYRWREDRVSCTRARIEYHLNMVGAEILNRAFRPAFHDTEAKAVLVPGCMRTLPADRCAAVRAPEGLRCTGCTTSCRVNQLREMGVRRGFDVVIIPHASDLSLWSPREGRPRRGVVGVACVTTLVEGGWELRRYDVPAQCVLLDYCGCKKHWHEDGVPTAINVRELKRVMGPPVSA